MAAGISLEAAGGQRTRNLEIVGVSRKSRCVWPPYLQRIKGLLLLLQVHEPAAVCHSARVRGYALQIAARIGLSRTQRRRLGLAARLHDVGKLGIPSAILRKPGRLTAAEYAQVQRHSVLGYDLLAPVVSDPVVLATIRHHHEHYDGRGYPDGLAGTRIPLLARIVAVADCFDALTSPRPYRQALSRAKAFEELRAVAGTQLDPDLVEVFQGIDGEWR